MFAPSNTSKVLWGQSYVFVGCCCVLVHAESCPILWDSIDCSPPGSSVRGISQARILQWPFPFSRGSSQPREQTCVSCVPCIAGRFCTTEPRRKSQCLSSYCFLSLSAWILAFSGLWIFLFLRFVDLLHQSTSLSLSLLLIFFSASFCKVNIQAGWLWVNYSTSLCFPYITIYGDTNNIS